MAGTDDDRVVGRIVVNRIDVRPVAACTNAGNITETVVLIHCSEFIGRKGLAGLRGIDVEADSPLIERLDHIIAIRIKDLKETEFINNAAILIHFSDHIADGVYTLAVKPPVVSSRNAQENMTVLRCIQTMRIISVAHRQAAVEDFSACHIVLGIALTVTEKESAVSRLLKAHHDAGFIRLIRIVHFDIRSPVRMPIQVLRPSDCSRRLGKRPAGSE